MYSSLMQPVNTHIFPLDKGMEHANVIIVGGGIVGLSCAYNLLKEKPGLKVLLLEKEESLALHQTGRNSGVLHSGIYYKPGSLKAVNCREGRKAMEHFCAQEGIDYDICGKVIVATEPKEIPRLEAIYERGQANGVKCEIIGAERLREMEPHCNGLKAIHVPEAGIINYRQVCQRLAEIITGWGGQVKTGAKVTGLVNRKLPEGVIAETNAGSFKADYLINCAGLYSDKVTAMSQKREMRIVPFRGEYYEIKPEAHHLCKNLIYPVPDPAFPFLGVHFTRMIDGSFECGPNAVLAFGRECYQKTDVNLPELLDALAYPALWKVGCKYWRIGVGEIWRSLSKRAFVKALQRLVPDIRAEHLETAPAGIRAQALFPNGKLLDDFFIQSSGRVINVCNAPSPAATAALNVGRLIAGNLPNPLED